MAPDFLAKDSLQTANRPLSSWPRFPVFTHFFFSQRPCCCHRSLYPVDLSFLFSFFHIAVAFAL